MTTSLAVLIVEDHQDIAGNIADYLDARGYHTDFAYDGVVGLHLAVTRHFDAIVLDVMLPGMDGLVFCRRLRTEAQRDTPVIMLTARDTIADKIEGFRAGTDDYLTKPFALEELEVRIRALHRRTQPRDASRLRVGDLELDLGTRHVRRAGQRLELTPVSFRILAELMRASPNVVTKEQLESMLWGDRAPTSDALRSQIYLLRQVIDRPFAVSYLVTVHGVGYRLADDAAQA